MSSAQSLGKSLAVPLERPAVQGVHPLLRLDVAAQVGQQHVVIAEIEQGLQKRFKDPRFHQVEEISLEHFYGLPDLLGPVGLPLGKVGGFQGQGVVLVVGLVLLVGSGFMGRPCPLKEYLQVAS